MAKKKPASWQRSSGKDPEGGLNEAGRKSYEKQNPGSDLKRPVSREEAKKSPKAAARRKSFCARSAGQMEKFPEAAKDPESRLRKARKKWDC
ncbi:MAG: DUF6321 domain-containing protein [bacterium]|jgi:hypothetical protein